MRWPGRAGRERIIKDTITITFERNGIGYPQELITCQRGRARRQIIQSVIRLRQKQQAAEEQVRVKQELADDSDDDSVIIISETSNAQSPQRPLRTRPRRNSPLAAPNSFDHHQHPSDALAFSSSERRLGGADPVIASITSDVLQVEKLPTPALSSTFRFPSPTSFIDNAIFGWKC